MKPILVRNAKILLVGEAPSEQELRAGLPFLGPAGQELDLMLGEAGLSRADVSLTNVFFERPPNGDLNAWAVPRKDLKHLVDASLPFAAIPCKKGVVDPKKIQPALVRLQAEIETANPNVIAALGNTPTAALCGVSGITKLRGALHFAGTRKVIPTYHPSAILRQYEWRPQVVADFQKVKIHAASPEANLLNRKIYLQPSLDDLLDWRAMLVRAEHLAFDIETRHRQITCIGFAPSKTESYVIPFWSNSGSYWPDAESEAFAYKIVRDICKSPAIKIAQNGLYDVQYLYHYSIPVVNFLEDTMIKHHSLFPALPKGLDFLGSIYADDRAWKRWRIRGGDQLKREE
jgi:DNA polymerase